MAIKISKEELSVILKRIVKKTNYDDVHIELEDIAAEYGIDLFENDEDESEEYIEIEEEFLINNDRSFDDEEDENW